LGTKQMEVPGNQVDEEDAQKGRLVSLQLNLVLAPMNDPTDADKAVRGTETAKKASRRRRRSYTREIAYSICERLVEGESLRQICQDTSMPARSTIFLWLEKHEEFAKWYTLAKRMQIEDLLDEALEIADDSTNDWIDREGPDGKKCRVFNPDNIRRSNLQIAARHWLISKLMPKKYT
jgi:hypothetical protein